MKFGKRIQAQMDGSFPEWRNKFVSYKALKKLLKLFPEATLVSPQGILSCSEEVEFIRFLHSEIHKFNEFFMEKEEELVIRFQEMKQRILSFKDYDVWENDPSRTDYEEKLLDIQCDIVAFHGELVLLENYSALNYLGMVKIVKKHDKRTGVLLRPLFLQFVLRQPFLTTKILNTMLKNCEMQFSQLNDDALEDENEAQSHSLMGNAKEHILSKNFFTVEKFLENNEIIKNSLNKQGLSSIFLSIFTALKILEEMKK